MGPLFAVSDTVWLALIGIVAMVVKEWFDQRRSDKTNVRVEQIHQATNGMKHELVEEVRKASFAQGVKSETDKPHTGGKP